MTNTPEKKPWSQKTLEERLDTAITHYETVLAKLDHDGTALTHDTYLNDPVRYSTAEDHHAFIQALHSIKGHKANDTPT